jgi:hypothetical protein
MPNDDPTKAAGGQQPENGDGEAGSGDQKWYEKISEEEIITPRKLQGIISANTASLEKRLETKLGELNKGLSDVVKNAMAAEKAAGKADDGGKKPNEQEAELALFKRKLEEAEGKISNLVSNLDESKQRESTTKKRQLIMNALQESGCSKPEVAYKYIEDDVQVEEDKAFVMKDNGYGAEEQVPLNDYVKEHVREKLLPELFRGANRGGSPASGDDAGGDAKGFKYDWEKVKNDHVVLASKEFATALEQNLVSNMHKGVPHTSGL